MTNKTVKKFIAAFLFTATLVSNYTISSADGPKVIIDPGHGGKDNGSTRNEYVEDTINLQIAKKLEAKLKEERISVEMTREEDKYVSLAQRANKSNKSNGDIFISIHQNSSLNSKARGIETYYQGEKNKKLANTIQTNIIEQTGAKDRGIRKGNLQVLRDNQKPSVLLECGFISNKNEGYKLSTAAYQDKIVDGIVDGIKSYLNIGKINSSKSNNLSKNTYSYYATVLSDSVKVMSDRGTKFKVLGRLPRGTKVEVINTKYDWHKIKYGNGYGYVSGVYVK